MDESSAAFNDKLTSSAVSVKERKVPLFIILTL
jgi:hypothetical protein